MNPDSNKNSTRKSWERDIVALDGSRRQISFTSASLPDGCELQVLTDLTVVTRLREQVGRLDTLAALGEMAAGVAHEIRNPLNGIDGFAGLLARSLNKSGDGEPMTRYAENIRRGVREVNEIITNLLTFASTETIQKSPILLPALIREIVSGFADHTESGVQLQFDCQVSGNTIVDGDPVKLKIIFSNLILNAIQAVDGEGHVNVTISQLQNSKTVTISVQDDGGGIPVEVKDKLFQPFCTTKASGTGLGLAIANKFAALHNAAISCHDLQGGTSFQVMMPTATKVAENNA